MLCAKNKREKCERGFKSLQNVWKPSQFWSQWMTSEQLHGLSWSESDWFLEWQLFSQKVIWYYSLSSKVQVFHSFFQLLDAAFPLLDVLTEHLNLLSSFISCPLLSLPKINLNWTIFNDQFPRQFFRGKLTISSSFSFSNSLIAPCSLCTSDRRAFTSFSTAILSYSSFWMRSCWWTESVWSLLKSFWVCSKVLSVSSKRTLK